jgi:hypothetical protein
LQRTIRVPTTTWYIQLIMKTNYITSNRDRSLIRSDLFWNSHYIFLLVIVQYQSDMHQGWESHERNGIYARVSDADSEQFNTNFQMHSPLPLLLFASRGLYVSFSA